MLAKNQTLQHSQSTDDPYKVAIFQNNSWEIFKDFTENHQFDLLNSLFVTCVLRMVQFSDFQVFHEIINY